MTTPTQQPTQQELAALKAAAEAATQGKWIRVAGYSVVCEVPLVRHESDYAVFEGSKFLAIANTSHGSLPGRDAEYIAAANPAAVLAMLALIDAQQKKIAEQDAQLQAAYP